MKALLTIALRNVVKNGRRSLLIGFAIFICCFILLLSNALGNGTRALMLREYYTMQAGDAVLLWEEAFRLESTSPSRIYVSQFESARDAENRRVLDRLYAFLEARAEEIETSFRVIRRRCLLNTGRISIDANSYGLSAEEWEFLRSNGTMELARGDWSAEADHTACISELVADVNGIQAGDWLEIEAKTAYDAQNAMDFQVTGIYRNRAPWNNDYVYLSFDAAARLYDFDPGFFDSMRFYLADGRHGRAFAAELDAYLAAESPVLRAAAGEDASRFFIQQADFLKSLYTSIIVFFLFVVGIGIMATVNMNLFERTQEFGTLRAIGFGIAQSFFIIFAEIFFLALSALLAALALSSAFVLLFARIGISVGSGTAGYVFGGSTIYPRLDVSDALFALLIIFLLSLLSPLKPGLTLCLQRITDMLSRRQRRIFVTAALLKHAFTCGGAPACGRRPPGGKEANGREPIGPEAGV